MKTPPLLFIELALLRLGKEIVDGLEYRSRTEKATQIVNHWHSVKEINDEVRNRLFKCWQELLLVALSHEKEIEYRQRESKTDTDDLNAEARHAYYDFCECVGGCLDSLAIA